MANINTKRKRKTLAQLFRQERLKGWVIKPAARKRKSPWRGVIKGRPA